MKKYISVEYFNSVAIVTYDRGEKKNALTLQTIKDLNDVAEQLRDRHDLSTVILAGSSNAFTVGVDLTDKERFDLKDKTISEQRHILSLGARMCRAWEDLPQITIACVEGLNVGGGVALMLCCDWRVLSESAYLYVPEVKIGINLGWNTIPRLVNMVGASRAKQIMLLNEKMSSEQALSWGVVDWLTKPGDTLLKAKDIAATIASNPSHVVKMTKQSVNAYNNALNHASIYMDVDQAFVCGRSSEAVQARGNFNSNW